jgi:hypothetical protein
MRYSFASFVISAILPAVPPSRRPNLPNLANSRPGEVTAGSRPRTSRGQKNATGRRNCCERKSCSRLSKKMRRHNQRSVAAREGGVDWLLEKLEEA